MLIFTLHTYQGSYALPVPEFIPFRLSPQMISVLSPLDGSILLRRYMVTTLNALREPVAVQQLHSALEIYLNDPVADWLSVEPGKGGKGDESGGSFSERESENWQPRRRIRGV